MKALSLRQPWADAVLFGGKRIENRIAWKTSNFRGPFLIHAAAGMTHPEYDEVIQFLERRQILWRPKPFDLLLRGGIIGIASVDGVVFPDSSQIADQRLLWNRGARVVGSVEAETQFRLQRDQWWMGAFALLLRDVEERPFVPWKGALGFFNVPDDALKSIAQTK